MGNENKDAFPEPGAIGMKSIDELKDKTVQVADVVALRDGTLSIVTSSGEVYLCDNEWASAGATFIQGTLNTSGADFSTVRVVEEADQVGFRPVEA